MIVALVKDAHMDTCLEGTCGMNSMSSFQLKIALRLVYDNVWADSALAQFGACLTFHRPACVLIQRRTTYVLFADAGYLFRVILF